MKINDVQGLFVGRNEEEDFNVLIAALDKQEAHEIANKYRLDAKIEGEFEISEFSNINMHFDCDYVLMSGQ